MYCKKNLRKEGRLQIRGGVINPFTTGKNHLFFKKMTAQNAHFSWISHLLIFLRYLFSGKDWYTDCFNRAHFIIFIFFIFTVRKSDLLVIKSDSLVRKSDSLMKKSESLPLLFCHERIAHGCSFVKSHRSESLPVVLLFFW